MFIIYVYTLIYVYIYTTVYVSIYLYPIWNWGYAGCKTLRLPTCDWDWRCKARTYSIQVSDMVKTTV